MGASAGPQHLAEPELLDFSRWRRRHGVAYDKPLRNVLRRDLLQFQKLCHGGEVDRVARFRHNDGTSALAQPFIGVSDDGDLGDGGVLVQQSLDLDDGYVLATSDDDVLAAA